MTKSEYASIENFMLDKMNDSAHDRMHVYRVLYMALELAGHEQSIDYDILLASCLLHDIGREAQFKNDKLDHAYIGGEMAFEFLLKQGWPEYRAGLVRECVKSHRFRKNEIPVSIEAKILYDADKLDVSGAIGIARTLTYEGVVSEPLYILDDAGNIVTDGVDAVLSSFFQEFNYKLKNIYTGFLTDKAKEIARERKTAAFDFYNNLLQEVNSSHVNGVSALENILGL